MHININIGLPFLVVTAGMAMAVAGCTKTAGLTAVDKDNTVFEVTSEFPTQKGATMNISHYGPSECRYAGYVYESGMSVDEAIEAGLAELRSESETESFERLTFSGSKYTHVVTGLMPNREYNYVVFGVNEDFTAYGTPGTCDFITQTGAALFSLNLTDAGEESAKIQVLPKKGYESYPYFVFWTADFDTPVEDLIEAKVKELDDPAKSVTRGGNIFDVPGNNIPGDPSGLQKGGKYRAIVTGLYEDGGVYGLPEELTFKTLRGDLPYEVNENWTVEYKGKGIYDGAACENIRVTTTDDNRYFIATVEASRLQTLPDGDNDQEDLRQVIDEETQLLREMIDEYTAMGMALTWSDCSYTVTTQEPFPEIPENTEYYAIAIGIDVDGVVTGYYRLSDKFTSEQPVATEEYNAWVGTWTVTSTYLTESNDRIDITFDIDIAGTVPGVGYSVSGFGAVDGITDDEIDIPELSVQFDSKTGKIQWTGLYLGPLTLDPSSGMTASLYFAAMSGDDVIVGSNFVMAESALSADHTTSSIEAVSFDVDGEPFNPTSMGYVAEVPYLGYMLVTVNPEFPMEMKKKDATAEGSQNTDETISGEMQMSRFIPGKSRQMMNNVQLKNRSLL